MISRKPFRRFNNYLLGAGSEIAAPLLRLLGRAWSRGSATSPATWRRGLIIGHTRIGDVLYRTCSLEQLKRALPACEWHYLATEESSQVLRGNPCLKSIWPLCSSAISLRLLPGGLEQLRALELDVALCTNAETYWLDLLLAVRLRIPNRVGFVHRGLSGLVTHPVPCAYPSSWPAYFRDLVASLARIEPNWPLVPRIYPSTEDEKAAAAIWQTRRLTHDLPTLVCFMTTREQSRVWPLDCYQRALEILQQRQPAHIVIAGSRQDKPVLDRFADRCGFECKVIAGELSLTALCSFLKMCHAVLATDSGPRHIANAAGTPVVYIRNLAASKIQTGNYCDNEIDLSPDVEYIRPERQEAYLRQVTPEKAARTLLEILSQPKRSGPK